MHSTDWVVIAAQSLWGICEYLIFRKMKSKEANADQKSYKRLYAIALTCVALGIGLGVVLRFDNWFGLYHASILYPLIGAGLILLGLVIRLSAINQLKRFFTINVAIRDNHRLVTDGWYRYIRHPAYAGGILSFIGCGICYGNLLSLGIIALPYILLILDRIQIEEAILLARFGDSYAEMQRHTKKLIPFIY